VTEHQSKPKEKRWRKKGAEPFSIGLKKLTIELFFFLAR
jgi:hypothetical protein